MKRIFCLLLAIIISAGVTGCAETYAVKNTTPILNETAKTTTSIMAETTMTSIETISQEAEELIKIADEHSEEVQENSFFTETGAVKILSNLLDDYQLNYMIFDDEIYMGYDAYKIKAFYDEGTHITTQGYYLVIKETGEVYRSNLTGFGYIKISEAVHDIR